MSAALKRAMSGGNVSVRNIASGEVVILFRNPVLKKDSDGKKYSVNINPVHIAQGRAMDLYARKDVDKSALHQSNLQHLLELNVLEVL